MTAKAMSEEPNVPINTGTGRLPRLLTLRAAIIAVILLILANIWVKHAALLTLSSQVAMSVPPIPALLALVVLLAVRRFGRFLRLARGELLIIYVFLTLAVALTSGGALRGFLPTLTALPYFATPENGWAEFAAFWPNWMAPTDPEVVRLYYEGGATSVPWGHWLVPLGMWSLLFLLILGTMLCAAVIFHDEWSRRERLNFQLAEIPLSMTAPGSSGRQIPHLWRDPVMWTGFALAALHNGLNILHAFNPAIPALGLMNPVGSHFTERPWSALGDIELHYRPEVMGLGFMMPQEVVVSSLLCYALLKIEGIIALALGYDIPRFPHEGAQGGGAFLALAVGVLWLARRHLGGLWRATLRKEGPAEKRWAVWGALGGLAAIWLWWRLAGMSSLTIFIFFGSIMLTALAYCRIRCETGLPLQWGYPVSQAGLMPVAVFGSRLFRENGGLRNLTLFYTAWFLTRGYIPNLSAYHFEGLRIAEEAGIRRREMLITLLAAVVLGMVLSYWMQLGTYYTEGGSFVEGGTHSGGMRVGAARYGFRQLEDAARSGIPPNRSEALAIAWGIAGTWILSLLRARYLHFPIHHLGFVIGTTRGYRAWGGFAVAATVKFLALHLGGVRLYRRLIPAAIGLVLGHFILAGGLWSLVAAFGGEMFRSYEVWFG